MNDSVYHPTNKGGDGDDPSRNVLAAGLPARASRRAGAQADARAEARADDPAPDRVPDSSSELDDEEPRAQSGGRFFAVDRHIWPVVCSLGMNPAVAYLVIACGTARDMVHSTWSVHAVETYTSISRLRAANAITALVQAGLVGVVRALPRPVYRLLPAHVCLSATARRKQPATVPGLRPTPLAAPAWIWLPNTLVTAAAHEPPPVELMRQTQDAMTLRLLVELYGDQHLRVEGGIRRDVVWEEYKRVKLGKTSPFVVWGFTPTQKCATGRGAVCCHLRSEPDLEPSADFWRRMDLLETLGLIDFVPHLVEGSGPDAEILHPYGGGETNSLEDRLGAAASDAGYALLTETSVNWATRYHVAPVFKHITNVQMIGIARLLYRPHTRTTAAWQRHLQDAGEKHLAEYERIVASTSREPKTCNLNG